MTYPLHSKAERNSARALEFTGDLYEAGKPFKHLVAEISLHLDDAFDDTKFTVTGKNTPGHRHINVEIYATADLNFEEPDSEAARLKLFEEVEDQVWRFGFDHSQYEIDVFARSFSVSVSISERYWSNMQRRKGANVIDDKVSLAKFKRELEPGHFFEDVHPEHSGGSRFLVERVGSRIVVVNELRPQYRLHWDFPSSAGFLCDGNQVRFAKGTLEDPFAYSLFKWVRP